MIRIMILDDDEMYLKKEKDITEQYFAEKNVDCTVTIYQNVEWFLLGLKEEKFDMYLLDIRMPGENGIEAAREIRRLYPDPVIIFITNFVDYAIEAYEVNTYRYIPKECLKEKLPQAYDALLPGIMEKEERYYIINKRNEVEKLAYFLYEKRRKICDFCAQAWGSKDQSKSVNSRKGTEFKRIYYI